MFLNDKSSHSPSRVPRLYKGMMMEYIYHLIQTRNSTIIELKVDTGTIYKHVNYPSVNIPTSQSIMLLLNLSEQVPDSSINKSIKLWRSMLDDNKQIPNLLANDAFWIKFPKSADLDGYEKTMMELAIGMNMNSLRQRMPNFVYTLGVFKHYDKCASIIPNKKMNNFCEYNNGKILHLIQERAKGPTMEQWLLSNPEPRIVMSVIIQIALALSKAQEKYSFVHGALLPCNIIIRRENIKSILYQLGDQNYIINTANIIPTIIDYSSARISHNGFALCYKNNPTIFAPGQDLIQLLSGCLALTRDLKIGKSILWLNEWIPKIFDLSTGSYQDLIKKYNNFQIDYQDPKVNIGALDFIHWIRFQNGKFFNDIVRTETRTLKPIIPNNNIESDFTILNNKELSSIPENLIVNNNSKYNDELLAEYRSYMISNPIRTYKIDYNSPLNQKYHGNYQQIFTEQEQSYKIISSYLTFLRIRKALGFKVLDKPPFEEKMILKYNLAIIRNLPFYRLYLITKKLEQDLSETQRLQILEEFDLIVNWIQLIFPELGRYLNQTVRYHINNDK